VCVCVCVIIQFMFALFLSSSQTGYLYNCYILSSHFFIRLCHNVFFCIVSSILPYQAFSIAQVTKRLQKKLSGARDLFIRTKQASSNRRNNSFSCMSEFMLMPQMPRGGKRISAADLCANPDDTNTPKAKPKTSSKNTPKRIPKMSSCTRLPAVISKTTFLDKSHESDAVNVEPIMDCTPKTSSKNTPKRIPKMSSCTRLPAVISKPTFLDKSHESDAVNEEPIMDDTILKTDCPCFCQVQ